MGYGYSSVCGGRGGTDGWMTGRRMHGWVGVCFVFFEGKKGRTCGRMAGRARQHKGHFMAPVARCGGAWVVVPRNGWMDG